MQFQKNKRKDVLVLLNFKSKVNMITPAYTAQLDLKVQKTNIDAWKIDGSLLKIYNIVIHAFHTLNKLGNTWFFQETFLLANISMKVVLSMFFLTFNNANV